jgi:hypothetical protein
MQFSEILGKNKSFDKSADLGRIRTHNYLLVLKEAVLPMAIAFNTFNVAIKTEKIMALISLVI